MYTTTSKLRCCSGEDPFSGGRNVRVERSQITQRVRRLDKWERERSAEEKKRRAHYEYSGAAGKLICSVVLFQNTGVALFFKQRVFNSIVNYKLKRKLKLQLAVTLQLSSNDWDCTLVHSQASSLLLSFLFSTYVNYS